MKMRNSYERALDILNKLPTNAMIQAALATNKLDNSDSLPEMQSLLVKYSKCRGNLDFLNAVHIAGSKGKGSVCAFTEKILRSKGLKTGMFISPHLIHPRERIRINGAAVGEEEFATRVIGLESEVTLNGDQISFFRFLWIVAVDVFLEAGVDVGIIEVGMGGRFDATNVLNGPVVCGITSLALEHAGILGPTIREIAWHKAGIIKTRVPVFSVQQALHPELQEVIEKEAQMNDSPLAFVNKNDWITSTWKLGISGQHQADNAALACALTSQWISLRRPEMAISRDDLKSSLQNVTWPGRQQIISVDPELTLFLDGSHTVESISATATWFMQSKSAQKSVLYFHCSPDRDFKSLLEPLIAIQLQFRNVYFMLPESVPGDVSRIIENHHEMSEYWNQQTGSTTEVISNSTPLPCNEPLNVLVCGSLYLVGHFMKLYSVET